MRTAGPQLSTVAKQLLRIPMKIVTVLAFVACCVFASSTRAQTQPPNHFVKQSEARDRLRDALKQLNAENEAAIAALDTELAQVGLENALRAETVTTEEGLRQNDFRFAAVSNILSRRQQAYAAFLNRVESTIKASIAGAENEQAVLERVHQARVNDEAFSRWLSVAAWAPIAAMREMNFYLRGKLGTTYVKEGQLAFAVPDDRVEFLRLVAKYDEARKSEAALMGYVGERQRQQNWQRLFDE